MLDENLDVQESENLEEEETSKNDEQEQEEEKDWKQLYENQKIRAEKAEKELKKTKTEAPEKKEAEPSKTPDYSLKDIRVLNKVEDDDVDDFLDLAKRFSLTPSEAYENKDVQAVLANRREERRTAQAANVSGSRRGTAKVSGEALLEKARSKGAIPENDKELDALLDARYGKA